MSQYTQTKEKEEEEILGPIENTMRDTTPHVLLVKEIQQIYENSKE